jgi:hypothetical protein
METEKNKRSLVFLIIFIRYLFSEKMDSIYTVDCLLVVVGKMICKR